MDTLKVRNTEELIGNHVCIDAKCGYSTNLVLPSEAEANEKLFLECGLNEKNNTRCPKCKQDTIQYLLLKNGFIDNQ